MPLGMELGLSPGDFVLDGDPALPSPSKGAVLLPAYISAKIILKNQMSFFPEL